MKLLMTVQPKNGEKPSEPMLVDTNEIDLCYLSDAFLRAGDKVLIFQPVTEYKAAPCGDCNPGTEYKAAPCENSFKKE